MTDSEKKQVALEYGRSGRVSFGIPADRLLVEPQPPAMLDDVLTAAREALASPLDFPPASELVIPGDRIALALAPATPAAAELVLAVWEQFAPRGISPGDVTIIEGVADGQRPARDPRILLPEDVRDRVNLVMHDPLEEGACGYLGNTTGGEKVYLSRVATEADVVVPLGCMTHDPILGYGGTGGSLYPLLSTAQAQQKFRGQGHLELEPDDERPLRQLADEVAWMLGTQFAVQVVPAGRSGVAAVLAGLTESVFRRGRELLAAGWQLQLSQRPEVLVLAIDGTAEGTVWEDIGAALSTARRIVARDGKVLLLTELAVAPGDGVRMLQQAEQPSDVIRALGEQQPNDVVAATQIAAALDWASVYLQSELAGELVEDLFMVPVDGAGEAARLVEGCESCVLLPAAEKWFARTRS